MCASYEGFARFQTPQDLLSKLHRDLAALEADPNNTDIHFNFYVTALHLLDWKYPDNIPGNIEIKREFTKINILHQICSHIANGAKHFVASAKKHKSISQVNSGGLLLANPKTETGYRFSDPRTGLTIELDGEAREEYGDSIKSAALAKHILDFWDGYLQAN